jgi:hypothetical protein
MVFWTPLAPFSTKLFSTFITGGATFLEDKWSSKIEATQYFL